MKLLIPLTCLALGLGLTLGFTSRADEPTPGPATPFVPGIEHALLQKYVGNWTTEIIAVGEDGKEQRSRGTSTTVSTNPFNTVDDFHGEFMGMKLDGHGINGFCAVRKQYYTLWTDSMTSSPMILFGDYDPKTKTLAMKGECLGMSGKIEPCRTVTHYQDADHYSFELYGKGPDGNEMRQIRAEYTRAK